MQQVLPQLNEMLVALPLLGFISGLFLLAVILVRLILGYLRLLRQATVCLELTPPAFTDRAPLATQQLFSALHGLGISRRLLDRLLGRTNLFALEIVATRAEGIRFMLRVPQDRTAAVEQMIGAYLPEVRVKTIDDYFNDYHRASYSSIVQFRQKGHFAYPLQGHDVLESHDPMAYITGAMTKLRNGELMSFQVLAKPVRVRGAEKINRKILRNEDLTLELSRNPATYLHAILWVINHLALGLTGTVTSIFHGSSQSAYQSGQRQLEYEKQVAKRIRPARTLSYFEHELTQSIHNKITQPLFLTDIRILISTDAKRELKERMKAIESAMSLFTVPKYQSLRGRRAHFWFGAYQRLLFERRLPSMLKRSNLLSATEVASLYHFPHSVTAKTDNVVKALSRTLPAPISLKNGTKLDILLGENDHHGTKTAIGLTSHERERHAYIIGGTGNGKTTMLLYGIMQDIRSGKGLAVVDPHGDLAETILRHIPEERIGDVVYLNPDDLAYPIGLNLLELPSDLSGDDLLREKDLVTESTISVMRKIFSYDDTGGHRIEYILRNTIQTALTIEGATLFAIFDLLNNTKYRRSVVRGLPDGDLKNFWKNELGKAGDFQRVKMSAGITAKVGRFLFSASAKRILEQPKSTINFDDILDSGKILICNFSKGLLGEDTSTLFGATVLAKLQMASLRRARLPQADRRPFYLYVDEFQNFATMPFVQMLSEARKYKLSLTMAEQSTSQQDQQRLVDIILANVGTVICFRSGSPLDERLVLPLFSPYIDSGEIANQPVYNFYMRIAAVQAQEPMSGTTVLLDDAGSADVAQKVIAASRKNNAIEYKPASEHEPTKEKSAKSKVTKKKQLVGSAISTKV